MTLLVSINILLVGSDVTQKNCQLSSWGWLSISAKDKLPMDVLLFGQHLLSVISYKIYPAHANFIL